MRTTIELADEQHRALNALAHIRGLRGLSPLVQEAVEAYLQDVSADEVDYLLSLEGMLSTAQADELDRRVNDVRASWRAA